MSRHRPQRRSSSPLSFHQESYVRQIVPSQCLAQPMAMPLAIARSWGEQAVFIMGHTSRCFMVCPMPQSHVSCSLENPHLNMFTLDRPTCVRNRLSTFQVVQGFSALAGGCSSALMLRCTLAPRGSCRSLRSSMLRCTLAPRGSCRSLHSSMLRCTLASRGSCRSLRSSMRAAFAVVLMGSVHFDEALP